MGAPHTPTSHSPQVTVPPQNLSKTTPQLAPSVSQVEGHEAASIEPTVKLESSPLPGMTIEVEPLVVVASGEDELPLAAAPLLAELPETAPKPPVDPFPLAAHPKAPTAPEKARHTPSRRVGKRSM
jgi:hypothetical protein